MAEVTNQVEPCGIGMHESPSSSAYQAGLLRRELTQASSLGILTSKHGPDNYARLFRKMDLPETACLALLGPFKMKVEGGFGAEWFGSELVPVRF